MPFIVKKVWGKTSVSLSLIHVINGANIAILYAGVGINAHQDFILQYS
jgi:hypothetical protein